MGRASDANLGSLLASGNLGPYGVRVAGRWDSLTEQWNGDIMHDDTTLADLLGTTGDSIIDIYVDATLQDLTSNKQSATV